MGCCFSTPSTTTTDNKNASTTPPPPPLSDHVSNRTPPPLIEEETVVKEVLSETPKSKPKPNVSEFIQNNNDLKKAMILLQQQEEEELQNDAVLKKPGRMVFNPDELSEDASEICSSTLSECREIHDDVSKIRQRSPAKYRNRQVSGERLVGQSPVRRSEPSPGRVRSGQGQGPGPRPGNGGGLVGNGQRRGSAQSPDRRSRSPATRVDGSGLRNGLGRCPSARRTGKSPGRVGSELSEKIRKVESGNGKMPPTSDDESLENPLVSLECFIFL